MVSYITLFTCQCVGWYKYRATHHVYASMLAVVDLVVPDDGAAIGSDLDASQRVPVDVVHFDEAPPIAKYVHASLVPVVDGIPPALKNSTLSLATRIKYTAFSIKAPLALETLQVTEIAARAGRRGRRD